MSAVVSIKLLWSEDSAQSVALIPDLTAPWDHIPFCTIPDIFQVAELLSLEKVSPSWIPG